MTFQEISLQKKPALFISLVISTAVDEAKNTT